MEGDKLNIADIRTDYRLSALDEEIAGDDPLLFFSKWFEEAIASQVMEANAMTLATVDADSKPHARIVLLKGLENKGFIFFTNYESDKGKELSINPNAALVFHWCELERQVRIEGVVERISEKDSDAYFHSRPDGSKIGAWASAQSQPVSDRSALEYAYNNYVDKFSQGFIPRPGHWGGYILKASKIEFWQGRSSRLHDRIVFQLNVDGLWIKTRLAP